jgi:hypothetical protein
MKTTRNVLFALLLLGSTAAVASASTAVSAGIHIGPSGRTSVDLGFFYDDLAPYGNWIERPSYGWVWTPRAVSTSWRPYQDGHWVWSDEGWVWVSDEPYGWATYHYGRWYDDPEIGWAWVPGDDWAPAWVSWQEGADYVGWAPLPPGINISVSYGRGYGSYAYGIAPDYYTFVPERYFLAPRIATYVLPQAQIYPIFGRTRNWTNYRRSGDRWFNQGVPVDRIQRFARVPRYQVADLGANYANYRHRGARFAGNRLEFFRPQVHKAARIAPPISRPIARRAVVSAAQFKAANPNRIARMNQRLAARQVKVDQKQAHVQQRQANIARQQVRVDRQQVRVDRRQQQAQVHGRGPGFGQQRKAVAQQQRQVRVDQKQARVQQKQAKVARQQVRVDRKQVRVDRRQQQAQAHGRGPSFRQQQKAMVQQRQQVRVDRRQTRVDRQQVRVDRQQARVDRQQGRAQRQQMRGAQQQRGGGRQHGQGGGGNPHHQRGGGRG